jgi:hypothetical protein
MMGLRELALIATVVLVLYGRSGVLKSKEFQTIRPWIMPVRRASASGRTGRSASGAATATKKRPRLFILRGNRLFWFVTALAATAVAAIIVTRALILNGSGPALR